MGADNRTEPILGWVSGGLAKRQLKCANQAGKNRLASARS
jgi:hypothetical protein